MWTGGTITNSYSSKTGSQTDILFTVTGYNYNQQCTVDNLLGQ